MIISSDQDLQPNTFYTPEFMTDRDGDVIEGQKMLVVRKATIEEYREFVALTTNFDPDKCPELASQIYFYEVLTD